MKNRKETGAFLLTGILLAALFAGGCTIPFLSLRKTERVIFSGVKERVFKKCFAIREI